MPAKRRTSRATGLAKRRGNPTSPLTSAMIEGAGFAAGNAIASPLIEIGKEVVRRGFGMRKGNPSLHIGQKVLVDYKKGAWTVNNFDSTGVLLRKGKQVLRLYRLTYLGTANFYRQKAPTEKQLWNDAVEVTDTQGNRLMNPGSLAQANPFGGKYPSDIAGLKRGIQRAVAMIEKARRNEKGNVARDWMDRKNELEQILYDNFAIETAYDTSGQPKFFPAGRYDLLSNPGSLLQAEQLSEQFHGRPVEADYFEADILEYDSKLADIGELIELSLWTGKKGYDLPITFNRPRPRLASSADGQQLYIVGGDQSLDNASLKALEKIPIYHDHVGTNRSKRKIPLGTLVVIAYKTDKHHLKGASGGQDAWEHHFGEETSKAPMLVYDTLNRKMEIVGGDYQVKDVGIVN